MRALLILKTIFFLTLLSNYVLASNVINTPAVSLSGSYFADYLIPSEKKQSLTFDSSNTSIFIREFNSGKILEYKSDNIKIVDDVFILEYKLPDIEGIALKLVLSGWEDQSKLYGTMLIYNSGKQINGIPVSFTKNK